jgi:hypothetical protein
MMALYHEDFEIPASVPEKQDGGRGDRRYRFARRLGHRFVVARAIMAFRRVPVEKFGLASAVSTREGGCRLTHDAPSGVVRAFDIETGEELWKNRLPAGGQATPMSYRVRPGGKQYVVIAAGGHGRGGSTLGDFIVAFALRD